MVVEPPLLAPVRSVRARKVRRWPARALLAAAAALLTLALAEIGLRAAAPRSWFLDLALLRDYERAADAVEPSLVADGELGHAPRTGGREYDEHGILRVDGPRGGRRVLFLGDSVTKRGRIVRALARLRPDCTCLNAGVEAWNAVQEVAFYFRVNHRAHADEVVLTFHNNDFSITPVALRTDAGFTMCAPGATIAFSPALYRCCYLYRLYVHARSDGVSAQIARADLVPATAASLRRLRDALAADGIRFRVLLLPILAPLDDWTADELASRRHAIEIFQALGLPWIDLFDPMQELLRAGVPVREQAYDRWHPNDAAALAMVCEALREGLLPGPAATACADAVVVRAGASQRITLDLGPGCADLEYRVLGSRAGTAPGVDVGGLHVPLDPDGYAMTTFLRPDAVLEHGAGRLDRLGRAVAVVRPEAGAMADGEAGTGGAGPWCFHLAVVFDRAGRIAAVTNLVPLLRVP